MASNRNSSSSRRSNTNNSSNRARTGNKKKKSTSSRKYGPAASKSVEKEMHEFKRGRAKSGPGGKGGKVQSREQAIAIGLSEARKRGAKVPKKKAA
jgi:hypothetical protein